MLDLPLLDCRPYAIQSGNGRSTTGKEVSGEAKQILVKQARCQAGIHTELLLTYIKRSISMTGIIQS